MRTTLQIDDDILNAARTLAAQRDVSLGRIISELARKGLRPDLTFRYESEFPVFEIREDAPVFGPDDVENALQEA